MFTACTGDAGGTTSTQGTGSDGGTTATTSASTSSVGETSTGSSSDETDSSGDSATSSPGTETETETGSDGTTTDEDPPLKGDCGTANLLGCYRGMYLSLYTDHTGQIVFGGDTEQHRFILGDADKEQIVLDFIVANRIESLALYNLGTILDDDALMTALASFMDRARDAGVLRIEAIGSTSTSTWDRIGEFHETHAPFDGFVTEIEFWNGGATFDQFIGILEYVRAKPLLAPSGQPPTLSVYVGWIDQGQVDAMLPLIDRAYVHVYVDAAPTAFGYGEARIEMFANANEAQQRQVEIWPLFSAEDNMWSAGSETFMGEWLTDNGLDAAELAVLEAFEAAPVYGHIELTGHQYFSYFFLERYLP